MNPNIPCPDLEYLKEKEPDFQQYLVLWSQVLYASICGIPSELIEQYFFENNNKGKDFDQNNFPQKLILFLSLLDDMPDDVIQKINCAKNLVEAQQIRFQYWEQYFYSSFEAEQSKMIEAVIKECKKRIEENDSILQENQKLLAQMQELINVQGNAMKELQEEKKTVNILKESIEALEGQLKQQQEENKTLKQSLKNTENEFSKLQLSKRKKTSFSLFRKSKRKTLSLLLEKMKEEELSQDQTLYLLKLYQQGIPYDRIVQLINANYSVQYMEKLFDLIEKI